MVTRNLYITSLVTLLSLVASSTVRVSAIDPDIAFGSERTPGGPRDMGHDAIRDTTVDRAAEAKQEADRIRANHDRVEAELRERSEIIKSRNETSLAIMRANPEAATRASNNSSVAADRVESAIRANELITAQVARLQSDMALARNPTEFERKAISVRKFDWYRIENRVHVYANPLRYAEQFGNAKDTSIGQFVGMTEWTHAPAAWAGAEVGRLTGLVFERVAYQFGIPQPPASPLSENISAENSTSTHTHNTVLKEILSVLETDVKVNAYPIDPNTHRP